MNRSPTYLYQLVPPLRSVKYNLLGANVYESNAERLNELTDLLVPIFKTALRNGIS